MAEADRAQPVTLPPGLWGVAPDGTPVRLLAETETVTGDEDWDDPEADWSLADLPALFGLGRVEESEVEESAAGESAAGPPLHLVLTQSEARQLKPLADAQSFDHPAGLIRALLAMAAFAAAHPGSAGGGASGGAGGRATVLRFIQSF